MRELARFQDEAKARRLGDVLFGGGIDNEVREERDGDFAVWVHRDDQLDAARAVAEGVAQAPDSEDVRRLANEAEVKRKRVLDERKASRHRELNMRVRLRQGATRTPYVTWGLIAISLFVALISGLGENREVVERLLVGDPVWAFEQGEPWRLVTPIFLHFGIIHLLFNMWWMSDLGAVIERRHGTVYLLVLVLLSGVFSNLAQLYLEGSRFFGGMSGVVYALLGFIWVRGRFDPQAGLGLHKQVVIFMLVWMALGFVGLFNMANYAHLGGLAIGGAWGYLSSGDLGRRLRR